jgi:hypothetical protein
VITKHIFSKAGHDKSRLSNSQICNSHTLFPMVVEVRVAHFVRRMLALFL